MATHNGTVVARARGVYVMTWSLPSGAFASGDVGNPFDAPHLPDKTVQVVGMATTETSRVVIEGTNGTASAGTYVTLTDPNDVALSFPNTATGQLKAILENPRFIRPRIDTATTDHDTVTVIITAQSGNR